MLAKIKKFFNWMYEEWEENKILNTIELLSFVVGFMLVGFKIGKVISWHWLIVLAPLAFVIMIDLIDLIYFIIWKINNFNIPISYKYIKDVPIYFIDDHFDTQEDKEIWKKTLFRLSFGMHLAFVYVTEDTPTLDILLIKNSKPKYLNCWREALEYLENLRALNVSNCRQLEHDAIDNYLYITGKSYINNKNVMSN